MLVVLAVLGLAALVLAVLESAVLAETARGRWPGYHHIVEIDTATCAGTCSHWAAVALCMWLVRLQLPGVRWATPQPVTSRLAEVVTCCLKRAVVSAP